MNRLLHLLCCVLLLCTAAGCSDKDDAQEPNLRDDASLIEGTWQTTYCSDAFYQNGKLVGKDESPDDWFTFELFPDGTFRWTEEGDSAGPDTGTWRYDTDDYSLTVHFNGLGGDFALGEYPITVTYLSSAAMVLFWQSDYSEEGTDYLMQRTLSFRRIL